MAVGGTPHGQWGWGWVTSHQGTVGRRWRWGGNHAALGLGTCELEGWGPSGKGLAGWQGFEGKVGVEDSLWSGSNGLPRRCCRCHHRCCRGCHLQEILSSTDRVVQQIDSVEYGLTGACA